MNQLSEIVVHIWGQDIGKRERFVKILRKTLRNQEYFSVLLLEEQIRDTVGIANEELLARIIGWASELMPQTGIIILVSTSLAIGKYLISLPNYSPDLELALDKEFITAASQRLHITGETSKLPEDIAQVLLTLESIETMSQVGESTDHPVDESVYSVEEEALLEEHLKSLGYM